MADISFVKASDGCEHCLYNLLPNYLSFVKNRKFRNKSRLDKAFLRWLREDHKKHANKTHP